MTNNFYFLYVRGMQRPGFLYADTVGILSNSEGLSVASALFLQYGSLEYVLKKQGGSNRATFTVRKNSNGIGVEKTWPLHSPNVEKIEVIRRGKVRRAKLNYLRDRVGKKAKVKELVK